MPADRIQPILAAIVDLARVDAPQALDLALAEARGLVSDAGQQRDPAQLRALQDGLQGTLAVLEREQQQVARELGALQREALHRQGYRSAVARTPAIDWRG
ncbi:MAG: hypothetical protein U0104_13555 [Gemmatimonadales bacterium]|nr:hypothetical protein [Gemmatimonadales bacterium]